MIDPGTLKGRSFFNTLIGMKIIHSTPILPEVQLDFPCVNEKDSRENNILGKLREKARRKLPSQRICPQRLHAQ
jgi:hypothetical protein